MTSVTRVTRAAASFAVVLSLVVATPAWAADTPPTAGAISGTLLNPAGQPLASTAVMAQGIRESEGYWSQTVTDAAGGFTTGDLIPGSYVVSFRLPGTTLRQYIPRQTTMDAADVVQVVAGQVTSVTDTALATGAVSGRLLEIDGTPAAGALAVVNSPEGYSVGDTADADGTYRIDPVFIGEYAVIVTSADGNRHQYVPGTTDRSAAALITVTAGAEMVVDDRFLPTGSIRMTATDATTGAPVAGICAEIEGPGPGHRYQCGTGAVTFDGVPLGSGIKGWVGGDITQGCRYLWAGTADIAVVAGETTNVAVALTPSPPVDPDDPGGAG